MKRLTGFEAIAYAEREGLRLNMEANRVDAERSGLTLSEAEAIASEDPDQIWIEVPEEAECRHP